MKDIVDRLITMNSPISEEDQVMTLLENCLSHDCYHVGCSDDENTLLPKHSTEDDTGFC